MQRHVVWAVLALMVWSGAPAEAGERGRWGFVGQPDRIVPFPYVVAPVRLAGADVTPRLGVARIAGRRTGSEWRRPAPWRYDPDPSCIAPQCLPSYYRPVYPPERRHGPVLPLAAVLERLKRLDYTAYGAAIDGPNYWIDAISRHGRPVQLIVNARTGMVRRTIP